MLSRTLSVSLVFAAASASGGTPFDYNDLGANWMVETFPDADCRTGTQQSPIDLTMPAEGEQTDNKMKFEGYEYKDYAAGGVLLHETHTLKMPVDSGMLRVQFPDGGGDNFDAAQLHFHSPSEHTVAGVHHDLEMHIVHTHADGGKYAVIGVFFEAGETESAFIKSLGFEAATEDSTELGEVSLGTFLGGVNMKKYWHYDGSFTTPPCTEGVEWLVVEEVQPISTAQLEDFQSYSWGNADYTMGAGNNRATQPVGEDRTLYYIDGPSGAAALSVGAVALSMLALF